LYKIKLKNANEQVVLDDDVYHHLITDPYLKKVDFINNLRKHSSGCAVFQKSWRKANGHYKIETIYLHRYIAEKFLTMPDAKEKNLVGAKNGNKLDCRLENLEWRTRSISSRNRKTTSKTGYTGVYMENKKYRAIITINGKAVHIGMFDTPESAARAYNKRAKEIHGDTAKLNKIRRKKREMAKES
jgi:hypothetical protein